MTAATPEPESSAAAQSGDPDQLGRLAAFADAAAHEAARSGVAGYRARLHRPRSDSARSLDMGIGIGSYSYSDSDSDSDSDSATGADQHTHDGSRSWRGGWTALALSSLARATLSLIGGLLLCSLLPAAFGWHPTVVMSASMAPRLLPGDLVVSRPVPSARLSIGEMLLVADPDHPGRLRLHRLTGFRPDGTLLLRGDANATADSSPVSRAAVHGVAALRVPWLGSPMLWWSERAYLRLLAVAAGLGLLLLATTAFRADEVNDDPATGYRATDDADGGTAAGEGGTPPVDGGAADSDDEPVPLRRAGLRRLATVGLVLTALTGAGLATAGPVQAATRFGSSAGNSANSWTAVPYFTCKAAALAATPFLYYPLAETTGSTSAADASANNRTGTYQGTGTVFGATGPCARDARTAVTLNGTSGWISTPTLVANPTVFTIEAWFKTTTVTGGMLMGFGNSQTGQSSSHDRHLYLDNAGHLLFGVYPNTVKTIASPGVYNNGAWHLADASLSSAGMQLYVDGQLVAADATVTTAQNYSGYWRVGYDSLSGWTSAPTSNYYKGTVADAAVYGSALTASQVAGHYNAA
jgi:hypothetical protein